jgi:uncharacterized membrane protein YoaK (UPF0700 family)
MSGNTTQAGLQFGRGDVAAAAYNLFPVPLFVCGVFAGTLLLHSRLRNPLSGLLGLVAGLLAIGATAAPASPVPGWLGIAALSFAMGAMNTTVTRVGEQPVSIGYMTGTLSQFAQHLTLAMKRVPVTNAEDVADTRLRRAGMLGGIWTAFLVGALLAGAATSRLGAWTLLPPALTLAILAATSRQVTESPKLIVRDDLAHPGPTRPRTWFLG